MTNFFMGGHGIVLKENKILVLKRANSTRFMPSKWDIPGGTVQEAETIEEAIAREFQEETNLIVKVHNPLFIYTNLIQLPNRQTFQAVYRCKILSGFIKLNPIEHQEYAWVSWKDLSEYDLIPFLREFYNTFDYNSLL